MPKYIIPLVIVIAAVVFGFNHVSTAEVYSNSCTISTSSARTVGHQASQTLLATSSNRAWASVQTLPAETNNVYVSISGGASATTVSGIVLGTSTDDIGLITFGRNTELPYVGAVTAITNTSTTTVLVTECNY